MKYIIIVLFILSFGLAQEVTSRQEVHNRLNELDADTFCGWFANSIVDSSDYSDIFISQTYKHIRDFSDFLRTNGNPEYFEEVESELPYGVIQTNYFYDYNFSEEVGYKRTVWIVSDFNTTDIVFVCRLEVSY